MASELLHPPAIVPLTEASHRIVLLLMIGVRPVMHRQVIWPIAGRPGSLHDKNERNLRKIRMWIQNVPVCFSTEIGCPVVFNFQWSGTQHVF